jgi:hypothetical protein
VIAVWAVLVFGLLLGDLGSNLVHVKLLCLA